MSNTNFSRFIKPVAATAFFWALLIAVSSVSDKNPAQRRLRTNATPKVKGARRLEVGAAQGDGGGYAGGDAYTYAQSYDVLGQAYSYTYTIGNANGYGAGTAGSAGDSEVSFTY